ncbi:MAG TPA: type II toxin-antitoxin system HicA family toxin [Verrucomicrobiae bacterium]|jgi:predicted RNA binding protein YcfA (HicA-like mRNA interferase family)|nr:type II toxin-antitoxin system HicA family toxin [Verrucomicrobiae bacterium]
MPRKIRQLMGDLEKAGFQNCGGKGSHRNYKHPTGPYVLLSGNPGDDAHHYQEKNVKRAIALVKE